jgi:anti-anti-sigma regulatory factor
MLRITRQTTPHGVALKLEGWLSGPWVREAEASWATAAADPHTRHVCLDLRDVHYVDEAGRELLTRMYRAGVAFATRGCEMPEVVREISETAHAGRQ